MSRTGANGEPSPVALSTRTEFIRLQAAVPTPSGFPPVARIAQIEPSSPRTSSIANTEFGSPGALAMPGVNGGALPAGEPVPVGGAYWTVGHCATRPFPAA